MNGPDVYSYQILQDQQIRLLQFLKVNGAIVYLGELSYSAFKMNHAH
jgi:hypothetical protein